MMLDSSIKEIWCETHDDVTVIFYEGSAEDLRVEFIQVKGHEFGQLWSIAKITSRESLGNGKSQAKSIVEKSLANDRCKEPCCFRIVTARPVMDELEVLNLARGCTARINAADKMAALIGALKTKLTEVRSPRNNDVGFWAEHTFWQVAHDAAAEKNRNLQRLHKVVNDTGHMVAPDQLDELYPQLVRKVWDAGTARFSKAPQEKKVTRINLIAWLSEKLDNILHPAQAPGKRLEEKMAHAHLPSDAIKTALEHRSLYLREIRRPKYLNVDHRYLLEAEVSACLLSLRSKLDAGDLSNNGAQFHSRCLEQVDAVSLRISAGSAIPQSFVFGCMYNITDRCLHRFMRAEA